MYIGIQEVYNNILKLILPYIMHAITDNIHNYLLTSIEPYQMQTTYITSCIRLFNLNYNTILSSIDFSLFIYHQIIYHIDKS